MSASIVNMTVGLNRRWGECAALADVQDALSYGAESLPITPATFGVVTNTDLISITSGQYVQMLDVAEWRGLMTIVANLDQVNLTAIGVKTDPEKLRLKYQRLLEAKSSFVMKAYGVGLPTLQVGTVNFNFQADFNPVDPQLSDFF